MSWNADRAKSRNREHMKTVPDVDRHVALDSAIVAEEMRKRGLMSRMPLSEAFWISRTWSRTRAKRPRHRTAGSWAS
jgi:hypothetical protein